MAAPRRRTVLCTWEIGGELGHISRLSAIVQALESEGYQVVVALKDLSRAHSFFCATSAILLQAPVWLPRISMQRPIACLADSMLLLGYLEPDPLDCLVQAWTGLVDLVQPDLVVFDYSPTAMLALLDRAIPKILVGTGFSDPVPGAPIADWRPYQSRDGLVPRQEQRVLDVINEVCRRRSQRPLQCLADLFAVDRVLITNLREIDCYGTRRDARYCLAAGPTRAPPVRFPPGRPRIVAYLKPAYPQFGLLLNALAHCDASVFVVCPQGPVEQLRPFASERFSFSTEVVDLSTALAQADLFIGHGNAGSMRESLVAGTPVMVLPIQLEQLLTGKKLQELGVGRLVERVQSEVALVALIETTLAQRQVLKAAIAQLLAPYPQPHVSVQTAVLEACGELLVGV